MLYQRKKINKYIEIEKIEVSCDRLRGVIYEGKLNCSDIKNSKGEAFIDYVNCFEVFVKDYDKVKNCNNLNECAEKWNRNLEKDDNKKWFGVYIIGCEQKSNNIPKKRFCTSEDQE